MAEDRTPAPSELAFEAHLRDATTAVVRIAGDVDLSNAVELQHRMDALLRQRPADLVFELGEVDFLDSSGIAVLVRAANAVPRARIATASAVVRHVLEITGLASLLDQAEET